MYVARVPNRGSPPAILLREELPRGRQGEEPHPGQPVALARRQGRRSLHPGDHRRGAFTFARNHDDIAAEAALDGIYVLQRTSLPEPTLPTDDVVARYKGLEDVERFFRTLNTELDVRPIRHRKRDLVPPAQRPAVAAGGCGDLVQLGGGGGQQLVAFAGPLGC